MLFSEKSVKQVAYPEPQYTGSKYCVKHIIVTLFNFLSADDRSRHLSPEVGSFPLHYYFTFHLIPARVHFFCRRYNVSSAACGRVESAPGDIHHCIKVLPATAWMTALSLRNLGTLREEKIFR
jgi:hypothetical protein